MVRREPRHSSEILVLGGGPAGATAARLLALWGHAVRLVTRPPDPRWPLVVSIPPSGGKLFAALGIADAIAAADFPRSAGNTVWWEHDRSRVEPFGDGRLGWQVRTSELETLLLREAVAAGVGVERHVVQAADAQGLTGGQENGPPWVLECSGRAGVLARPLGLRRDEPTHRSIALIAGWERSSPWPVEGTGHTLIETYGDGWAWSVPDQPSSEGELRDQPAVRHLRHIAVMVDPAQRASRPGELDAAYLAELARTARIASLLAGARQTTPARGWDAGMYGSARYVDSTTLLVGDAGSFVDPLSSAGVRKALMSAWVAAAAVHTAIARPEHAALALDHFDQRERHVYHALRQLVAQHLAGAARGHAAPFWTDRAEGVDLEDHSIEASPVDARALQAAYDHLRQTPTLRVCRDPSVRTGMRGVLEGNQIVPRAHLVPSDGTPPVRHLAGVDAILLTELAPTENDVGVLFEHYCRRAGPTPLPAFLTALSELIARGWLVEKTGRQGDGEKGRQGWRMSDCRSQI